MGPALVSYLNRRTAFRLLKAVLVATILIFATAACYMSFLIFERQESLGSVSHFDVTWSASQGVNEFARLHQRVTRLAEDSSPERLEEVKLRFEILKGRLKLFTSGAFQAFLDEDGERRSIKERFSRAIEQMEGMLDRLDRPGTVQEMLNVMAPLEGDLVGLASEAAYFSSVRITDFERELLALHQNFSITALGFFICGISFVALLGWHNRLLGRTHKQLEDANRELHCATQDLAHVARHDIVTGLPNRLLFREHLQTASARGGGACAGMMCLDLDNFKNVNDTLGHPTGDALLSEVAARITSLVGSAGIVARFGGDEFVIALSDLDADAAARLAGALVEAVGRPYDIDGHQINVGISIGVAMAAEAVDSNILLRNADLALYRAKGDGRGTYRFFEPEMDTQLQRRRMLDFALRSADFDSDFQLLFQPLVDLHTRRFISIEVLLRWPNTPHGTILPDEFIPLAESSGIIVPLGAWVLRKACAVVVALPPDISLAVNLSAVQFRRSDIVETISSILSETGLAPNRLELEITESLLLEDSSDVRSALGALRAQGIRISLDDFGTGFSSLAYLRKFTVDKVKIDRSFVTGIDQNPDHLAIVQAIVGLAHALGMTSVAEGVETEEQLLLIRASGCHQAQGHLFSRPVREEQIRALIADQGRKSGAVWSAEL